MRDFFKYTAASALGALIALFSLVALLGIGAMGLVSLLLFAGSTETEPEVKEQSMLVFDLSTDIVDAVPYSGLSLDGGWLSGENIDSVSLHRAIKAIAAAATDDRIVGLYLTGNTNEDFATLTELRSALETFKQSGKPVLAYGINSNERDYYLTSVADTLYQNPVGLLELNGFRAEIQFLAGALDKYGVGVQVLRAGRYKSAVEPFIRESSSPEEKQQTEALLSDLWQDFLATTGQARDLTPQRLQQIADSGGLLTADQAVAAKLVDKASFADGVLKELQTLTEAPETPKDDEDALFPQVSLYDYSRIVAEKNAPDTQDTVAVVYAAGEIVPGSEVATGVITASKMTRTLRKLRNDPEVKAVVLRINSPGGSAEASEIITREVELLAAKKPLIVSMGDYAASGGYMMAAPGQKIFASPGTITGSIGVFGLLFNLQDIANRNGITWDTLETATFADIDTISRPKTEAELKLQQDLVNDLYSRFVALVAKGRKVSPQRVNQVAQGRVWTGQDALQADLVDELGGLEVAIAAAAKAAELEIWQVEEFPEPPSFEQILFENLFGVSARWRQDRLSQEFAKLQQRLQTLHRLDDPNGLYLRLPFTTEID
jgi:protease-4